MKKLLFLTFVVPMIAFAQNKQDYGSLVDKFVSYYNKKQTDNICTLFPDEKSTGIKCFWEGASTDGTYNIYGKITDYRYIGTEGPDNRKVTKYKVVFSKKGAMTMRFNVNKDHKFMMFLLEPF